MQVSQPESVATLLSVRKRMHLYSQSPSGQLKWLCTPHHAYGPCRTERQPMEAGLRHSHGSLHPNGGSGSSLRKIARKSGKCIISHLTRMSYTQLNSVAGSVFEPVVSWL